MAPRKRRIHDFRGTDYEYIAYLELLVLHGTANRFPPSPLQSDVPDRAIDNCDSDDSPHNPLVFVSYQPQTIEEAHCSARPRKRKRAELRWERSTDEMISDITAEEWLSRRGAVALVRLSIEKFEATGRPLRIAVDTSIWSFQVQAVRGATLRNLYYRLLRLLSAYVQPLFVFDGANKPPVKRNKPTTYWEDSKVDVMFKQLLYHFGVPYHIAPGEAEAECALLQHEGIVDAVLSEDADTLLFGCGVTLRNWSAESPKRKVPTHIDVYDAKIIKQGKSGLDPQGMILFALLSGGDYDTSGVTGFGPKIASQAARAGFGESLCGLSTADVTGYERWRERFNHEVQTNESKYFKSMHKTLELPEGFPKLDILGYYTHPVISDDRGLFKLREKLVWQEGIDVPGLRQFVAEAFAWRGKVGAKKLIRGLAPVLLIHKLRSRRDSQGSDHSISDLHSMDEKDLVKSICGTRAHLTTDALPEIRVLFKPNDIVRLDIEAEDVTRDYGHDSLVSLSEDEIEAFGPNDELGNDPACSASLNKRVAPAYDPSQPERAWIAQSIVKVGAPLMLKDYEESLWKPEKLVKRKIKECS